MYLKKNSLVVLLTICCISTFCCLEASTKRCSLDDMKIKAMNACEGLFDLGIKVREKRSLDYGSKKIYDYLPKQPSKHSLYVRRCNYLPGGYLKVSQEYYNKLSLLDVRKSLT